MTTEQAIYINKPEVGYPIADPYPVNPQTGMPWEDWEVEEIRWLLDMTRGLVLLVGDVGAGKSLFLAWLGFKLKKYFGIPVVADFPLVRENFGEYTYLPKSGWPEELEKMEKIVERTMEIGVDAAYREGDSKFYQAAVLLDECHKDLNKRRGGTNLAILITEVFTLWRHYQGLFVVASPKWDLIERVRFDDFITHEIGAKFDEFRGLCYYNIYVRRYRAYKRLTLTVGDWCSLYLSYCPVAASTQVLRSALQSDITHELLKVKAREQLKRGGKQ